MNEFRTIMILGWFGTAMLFIFVIDTPHSLFAVVDLAISLFLTFCIALYIAKRVDNKKVRE